MNTPNNRRRSASRERMEQILMELLQTKELDEITVSEICKRAGLNRTTFYANYADIYALADAIRDRLESSVAELYREEHTEGFNSNDYLKLFRHIRDNQAIYRTYFKLGYDGKYQIITYDRDFARQYFGDRFVLYHAEFFRAGITRIIKLWLENGCQDSPEDLMEVLRSEYQGR